VAQLQFEGKTKEKIELRLKKKVYVFRFDSVQKAAEWMKAFHKVWSLKIPSLSKSASLPVQREELA